MIEITLISFIVLVSLWFVFEYKKAAKEYNPFKENSYDLSKEEEKIYERYKRELL